MNVFVAIVIRNHEDAGIRLRPKEFSEEQIMFDLGPPRHSLFKGGTVAPVLLLGSEEDGEVVGEYTLSQSRSLDGFIGLALLSGTNKDYGTRCEVSDLHVWEAE